MRCRHYDTLEWQNVEFCARLPLVAKSYEVHRKELKDWATITTRWRYRTVLYNVDNESTNISLQDILLICPLLCCSNIQLWCKWLSEGKKTHASTTKNSPLIWSPPKIEIESSQPAGRGRQREQLDWRCFSVWVEKSRSDDKSMLGAKKENERSPASFCPLIKLRFLDLGKVNS